LGQIEVRFGLFGDSANLDGRSILEIVLMFAQNRCTICAKCTTSMEMFLVTPGGPPRWRGLIGSSFRSIQR
jgi:hypothetical protein